MIAVGVLALLGIGAYLVFGGGVPGIIDDGPDAPGPFSFELDRVVATPISATPPEQLRDAASEAGADIKVTMDELYFRAFVDRGSWGDYSAVFELFEGRAASRAEDDAEVLTLGMTASDEFESLDPTSGTLRISVLTDRQDAPVTAVAEVEFQADAQTSEGASTQIVSAGSFFLHLADGAWRIFAYDVDRDDLTSEPSPTGSP